MSGSSAHLNRVVNLGVHDAPVEKQQLVSLFFRANVNILRADDAVLEFGEEVSHFLHVINDLGLLVRAAADKHSAHDIRLHMEVFAACHWIDPNKGELPKSFPVSSELNVQMRPGECNKMNA